MESLIEKINKLKRINKIENRLSKLITYLEQYVSHRKETEAKKLEQKLLSHIIIIISHLNHLQRQMQKTNLKRDIEKEVKILLRIEDHIIDFMKNPTHLNQDAMAIKSLQKYLLQVKNDEVKQK